MYCLCRVLSRGVSGTHAGTRPGRADLLLFVTAYVSHGCYVYMMVVCMCVHVCLHMHAALFRVWQRVSITSVLSTHVWRVHVTGTRRTLESSVTPR